MKSKWIYAAILLLLTTTAWSQERITKPLPKAYLDVDAVMMKSGENKHPKLDSSLVELSKNFARTKKGAMDTAVQRGMLVEKGSDVLVEIRVNAQKGEAVSRSLSLNGARVRHHNVPTLYEAWVPVNRLMELVKSEDIHFVRPARKVIEVTGASTAQGVAASLANTWHAGGIDGTGVTIANIDAGYTDFALRQASGDWPTGGAVTLIDTNLGGFGNGSIHGTATVEINYDMAPGADYRIYETSTVNDWYNALTDATTNGADVVSVSLGAPLDGVGDGSDCPPGWGSPCGTIAEASTAARNAGVLVVNAAGNERESHWGGLYAPMGGNPNTLDFGGASNVNYMPFCLPTGYTFTIQLFWDDWTNVNHDYDITLVEFDDANTTWVTVASATNTQNGGPGQSPQEFLAYTVSSPLGNGTNCPTGFGIFGIVINRVNAPTNRNLQLFTSLDLNAPVNARSLGFPADSPSVMTVAAIDQGTYAQESYSSEGPVLGPGGSLAATTIAKPNIAAYANVDTEAYGAGSFNGTSAATPHVAGAAALVLQEFPSYVGNPHSTQEFLENCAPDLGVPGYDTLFGAGRLEMCSGTFDTWTHDNNADVGNEPYGIGSIWHSPDIKICTTQNCATSQNPEFGQTNYVYVTLNNNGPNAVAPQQPAAGTLEVYFSGSGGASQWPVDWTLIDAVPVTLEAGEVRDIEVEWTNVPAPGHYCMLSRWVSVDDPMAFVEVAQTTTNVRNNNNLSWKNFNVVDLLANIIGPSGFTMRNIMREPQLAEMVLRFGDEDRRFLEEGGIVRFDLEPEVMDRWVRDGGGKGIKRVGETTLQMDQPDANLLLPMEPDEDIILNFEFEARNPFNVPAKEVEFAFEAIQFSEGQDVGGVAYNIRGRALYTDTDGDRIPDVEDPDDDNDGVPDEDDVDPIDPEVGKEPCQTYFIDFRKKSHNLNNQAGVKILSDFPNSMVALQLNLNAKLQPCSRALVEVHYGDNAEGVSFQAGDDAGTNGAFGQLLNNTFFAYGDASSPDRLLDKAGKIGAANTSFTVELGHQFLEWKRSDKTGTLQSNYLYNLQGGNNDVVLSFNGNLNGDQGAGVEWVKITLLP